MREKSIDVRMHFVRDIVEFGEVRIEKIVLKENLIDMFTKSLPMSKAD